MACLGELEYTRARQTTTRWALSRTQLFSEVSDSCLALMDSEFHIQHPRALSFLSRMVSRLPEP